MTDVCNERRRQPDASQTPDLVDLDLTTVQLDLTRNAHLLVYKKRPNLTSLVAGQLNNL